VRSGGCSSPQHLPHLYFVPPHYPLCVLSMAMVMLCPTWVKSLVFSQQVFPKKLVAFSTWIDRTRWARNTWAMAAIIIVTMADIVDMVRHGASAGARSDLLCPSSP